MSSHPAADPVKNTEPAPWLTRLLAHACNRAGLSEAGATLVHHYSNAVWQLPEHNAVLRIARDRHAARKAELSVAVTRWLTDEHAFPATRPWSSEVIHVDTDTVASVWTYYPQPSGQQLPGSAHLGRLLRHLHELPQPPIELPEWQPLNGLARLLTSEHTLPVSEHDRRWLLAQIDDVRAKLTRLDWPLGYGLIHADAWAGNLLWDTTTIRPTALLGDWDSVCWGPREVDLIPSWHAATRYGRGDAWAAAFADTYGYDVSRWPGFPVVWAMRDLVQLSGPLRRAAEVPELSQALQQRLNSIKTGDTTSVWRAY